MACLFLSLLFCDSNERHLLLQRILPPCKSPPFPSMDRAGLLDALYFLLCVLRSSIWRSLCGMVFF